jgi:hypothetical protein
VQAPVADHSDQSLIGSSAKLAVFHPSYMAAVLVVEVAKGSIPASPDTRIASVGELDAGGSRARPVMLLVLYELLIVYLAGFGERAFP